jgi:hypothetical protein
VRDTGVVFSALTERQGQLQSLIVNSNRVFEATASRDAELAETFRILPTFLDESRLTVDRVTEFAKDTDPLITQLRPAARELSPTLIDLAGLAPDLKAFFRDLDPLIRVSKRGLPALESFLDETTPLLAQLDPFLRQLNPILTYLGYYKHEITAFFANDVGATQATQTPAGSSTPIHYLRTSNPVNPENLAAWPYRLSTNRSNPYTEPLGYNKIKTGLEVFGERGSPDHAARVAAAPAGAAGPNPGVRLWRPAGHGRAGLQAAGSARPAPDRHTRRLPARRSCARAVGVS